MDRAVRIIPKLRTGQRAMSGRGVYSRVLDRLPTLRVFLDWWVGELADLLPDSLKRSIGQGSDSLVVSISNTDAELSLRQGGSRRRLGSLPVGDRAGDEGRSAFEALTRGISLNKVAIGLRLPDARLLRMTREFPIAAEPELRRIVGNQIDRLTPYSADQVHFDCRIVERDPRAKKLTTEIVTLPRTVADGPMARMARWGVRPTFIEVGAAEDEARTLAVGVDAGESEKGGSRLSLNAALASVNVALIIIAVGWPLLEKSRIENELRERVATAEIRAKAAAKVRAEVDRVRAEASYLAVQKGEVARTIAILNEITRVLPDGTWLEHLTFDGNELQVRGISARAASLIGDVEASALFANARFRAPVTRQSATGREQFHIATELAREESQ